MQRYLKFNHGSECPLNVLSCYASWNTVTLEGPSPIRVDRSDTIAWRYSRWESGQWAAEKRGQTNQSESLWSTIDSLLKRKQLLWIFSHGLTQQAELIGIWEQLEQSRLSWQSRADSAAGLPNKSGFGCAVVDGHPWFIRGQFKGKSVRIVDICNYVQTDISGFAKGYYQLDNDELLPKREAFDNPGWAVYVTQIIHGWITGAIDRWREYDAGTWQPTAAKLAMNAYMHHEKQLDDMWRSSLGKKSSKTQPVRNSNRIATHNNMDVKVFERSGYHGGRAEAYYFGEYKGRVAYVDVRSMYPFVCCSTKLPVRHYKSISEVSPKYLQTMLDPFIAIAEVTVAGPGSFYPCKVDHKHKVQLLNRDNIHVSGEWFGGPLTIYPEGRYRTVLAGEELRLALARNHVVEVHRAELYNSGMPLKSFMEDWYARRLRAEDSGDAVLAQLCKLVMNGLPGKLGQRSSRWIDEPGLTPDRPWKPFCGVTAGTKATSMYRSIGWKVQRYVEPTELEYSAVAVPACITAAGREMIRHIMSELPDKSVLLCDTDGLIITDDGLNTISMKHDLQDRRMGCLRVDGIAESIEVLGPRHYRWGDKWVLSGLHRGWEWTRSADFKRWVSDWLLSRQISLPHGYFAAKLQPWDMGLGWTGRIRLADGWSEPLLVGI